MKNKKEIIKINGQEYYVKDGKYFWCFTCKRWFPSSKYVFEGTIPKQCNLCKSVNWFKRR